MGYVKIEELENDKIRVITQYNSRFVNEAKSLGGKWDKKGWCFDKRILDEVKKTLRCYYYDDGDFRERVDVEIKTKVKLVARLNAYFMGGRLIASATSKSSGARIGEGIVFLQGGVDSGGSMRYWETQVEADSIFQILDLTKDALKSLDSYVKEEYIEYKIISKKTDTQKKINEIKKEIEKLQKLLAETEAEAEAEAEEKKEVKEETETETKTEEKVETKEA